MFSARYFHASSFLNSLVSCPILSYGTFMKICGMLYLLQQISIPHDSISTNHILSVSGVLVTIDSDEYKLCISQNIKGRGGNSSLFVCMFFILQIWINLGGWLLVLFQYQQIQIFIKNRLFRCASFVK